MKCKKNKKYAATLVSLLLLLLVAVGGTYAFLITGAGPIENVFTPSAVTTSVVETRQNDVKKNVMIQNTGDTEAWIRAAIVITWQDSKGNVYSEKPVLGTDYTMSVNTSQQEAYGNGKWTKSSDGFYYWSHPVKEADMSGEQPEYFSTGILIDSVQMIQTKVVGEVVYSLNVEILGSGIQSVPNNAVTSAWSSGVSAVSGTGESRTLTIKQ